MGNFATFPYLLIIGDSRNVLGSKIGPFIPEKFDTKAKVHFFRKKAIFQKSYGKVFAVAKWLVVEAKHIK